MFIAYAYFRQQQVEGASAEGDQAAFDSRADLVFAAIGATLGLGTILLIVIESP